jgi:hypothetical protein
MVGVFDDKQMKLIPNPACLHFFKSKAPDDQLRDNLFVYQHQETKKFIVAKWIGGDVFLPVVDLGLEPTLDDEIVQQYFVYCHPQAAMTIRQGLKQAKDNQQASSEDLEYEQRIMRAKILQDEFHIKVSDEDGTCYLPTGLVGSENC